MVSAEPKPGCNDGEKYEYEKIFRDATLIIIFGHFGFCKSTWAVVFHLES